MISVAGLGLGAGFGAIVGIALGAYIKGMFGEAGKIDAAISRLEDVGKKAFKEAFESESGKRLASHQDLTNVLDELRKVTTETESIKAQISGDTWLKQTVWTQKRTAYAELLKAVANVQSETRKVIEAFSALKAEQANPSQDPLHDNLDDKRIALAKQRMEFYKSLTPAGDRFIEAELFDSSMREWNLAFNKLEGLMEVGKAGSTKGQNWNIFETVERYRRELMHHMRLQLEIDDVAIKASASSKESMCNE